MNPKKRKRTEELGGDRENKKRGGKRWRDGLSDKRQEQRLMIISGNLNCLFFISWVKEQECRKINSSRKCITRRLKVFHFRWDIDFCISGTPLPLSRCFLKFLKDSRFIWKNTSEWCAFVGERQVFNVSGSLLPNSVLHEDNTRTARQIIIYNLRSPHPEITLQSAFLCTYASPSSIITSL